MRIITLATFGLPVRHRPDELKPIAGYGTDPVADVSANDPKEANRTSPDGWPAGLRQST
jgi:hypothetical protein